MGGRGLKQSTIGIQGLVNLCRDWRGLVHGGAKGGVVDYTHCRVKGTGTGVELLGVKVQGPLELRISGYRTVVCQDSARGHLEECRTLEVGLHGSDHARIHQDCVDSDCLCS